MAEVKKEEEQPRVPTEVKVADNPYENLTMLLAPQRLSLEIALNRLMEDPEKNPSIEEGSTTSLSVVLGENTEDEAED